MSLLTRFGGFKPALAVLFALTSVGAAGCSSASEDPGIVSGPGTAAEIPAGATALPFDPVDEVSSPVSAILDRRRLVIRDSDSWELFWSDLVARIQPRPVPPTIDFRAHMVLAATMGQQTSGGYTISVEEVAEMDGTLYAAVQEVTPGALCITTDVITAPAVAVVVPRHDGTVAFVDTEVALPCAP